MTPYRIAVVDDLERDRAWLAEKLADYMARDRLEYELTAFASGEGFSAGAGAGPAVQSGVYGHLHGRHHRH